ncbi:MAG: CDP-alcohol phosphatidyltransferase family protein [Pirellulales bacterium]
MTRHPISRWYLVGAVVSLSRRLAATAVRPWHLTIAGAALVASAVTLLVIRPEAYMFAAPLVWGGWLMDRLDGAVARRQRSTSRWGAWLDANLDEAGDLALQLGVASAAAAQWPATAATVWGLLVVFIAAKYLLVYGISTEGQFASAPHPDSFMDELPQPSDRDAPRHAWRALYHLPGNADVRLHLLLAALLTGWLWAELALVAAYYALRVVVRYILVARRLAGGVQ